MTSDNMASMNEQSPQSAQRRFQFSTSSILLATSFVGICIGGMLPLGRRMTPNDQALIGWVMFVMSPFWVPFLYIAYAMGRRTLTLKTVLAFAVTELAAAIAAWLST